MTMLAVCQAFYIDDQIKTVLVLPFNRHAFLLPDVTDWTFVIMLNREVLKH